MNPFPPPPPQLPADPLADIPLREGFARAVEIMSARVDRVVARRRILDRIKELEELDNQEPLVQEEQQGSRN